MLGAPLTDVWSGTSLPPSQPLAHGSPRDIGCKAGRVDPPACFIGLLLCTCVCGELLIWQETRVS